jgi:hypothetical protein
VEAKSWRISSSGVRTDRIFIEEGCFCLDPGDGGAGLNWVFEVVWKAIVEEWPIDIVVLLTTMEGWGTIGSNCPQQWGQWESKWGCQWEG